MSDPRTTPQTEHRPGYHPTGGWNERRTHNDGHSYWRDGKLHRADGYAVDRDTLRQVWLFGKLIPSPETADSAKLSFAGQNRSGHLHWLDSDDLIRVSAHLNAHNAFETRYYTADGEPEPHWRGGYNIRVDYDNGERRFFKQMNLSERPVLHRLDGPAIELPSTTPKAAAKSKWLEDGQKVDGPIELFIRHKMKMSQSPEDWAPPALTDREAARLRAIVIADPNAPMSLDVAFTYSTQYAEAICYLDGIAMPEETITDEDIDMFLSEQEILAGESPDPGVELVAGPDMTIGDLLAELDRKDADTAGQEFPDDEGLKL